MDATALLARLGQGSDLGPLLSALGGTAAWQRLPPGMLPTSAPHEAWLTRAGSFEWLALTAASAAHVAERLSLVRTREGRLTGVIALDGDARLLAIAVAVEGSVTATFPLDHPSPSDCERLRRLLTLPEASGLSLALRVSETLRTEDVGRRFFVAFRDGLERMADSLAGPSREADRRALALIQLTRVLFLYFVQAKGWLNGRGDFLRQAVDDALARRRRLHRDLFRPLFFGTLNRRPDERARARAFGRIPFLNGGLFEPHPLERRGGLISPTPRGAMRLTPSSSASTSPCTRAPTRDASPPTCWDGCSRASWLRPTGGRAAPSIRPRGVVRRLVETVLEALLVQRLGLSTAAAGPGSALRTRQRAACSGK